ncbi:MAG TPA: sensor histidine kinase [Acidimicrobiales bacterium]|nr:sensor histidine kinase [Acidimicrobiales bacterium]
MAEAGGAEQAGGSVRAWSLTGAALVFTALNLVLLVANTDAGSRSGLGSPPADGLAALAYVAASALGALIASRHPRNPVGWLFCVGGLALALAGSASEYADYGLVTEPGSLPLPRVVAWLGAWTWWAAAGAMVTFVFLLFPDGRLPSPRWRPMSWLATGNLALLVLLQALTPGPLHGEYQVAVNPFGLEAASGLLERLRTVAFVLLTANAVMGITALIVRLRTSHAAEQQRIKWLLYSGALAALAVPVWSLTLPDDGAQPVPVQALVILAILAVPVAAAIAILKHRLYDIDLVINKTVVFAVLAAFVTGTYVATVVAVGQAVGAVGPSGLGLSIVATAVVAVLFEPVRTRVQLVANKLVYGDVATPYDVVTDFSQRMSAALSLADVLPGMAEAAARGVRATRSRVRLFLPDGGHQEVIWPGPGDAFYDHTVEVVHQGEVVGDISVAKAPGETLTENDERLLSDLGLQAGLAMRNLRLTGELEARLRELQASRERIVAAQDQERRRMERDLHDGAQQQLIAISIKLRLAKGLLAANPEEAANVLGEVQGDITGAIESLRNLARGIFPALLTQQGLAPALRAHVEKMGLDAEVAADDLGESRFGPKVEAAVYFCLVEALQNASKHAPGTPVQVKLARTDGSLQASVADRGPGFSPERVTDGSGLQNMVDRLEAVGGSLEVRSGPGQGTQVLARVPVAALNPTPPSAP